MKNELNTIGMKKCHEGDIIELFESEWDLTDRRIAIYNGKYMVFHCISKDVVDYIHKLQFQHWMDRAKIFECKARIQSDYGDGLHDVKYKRFRHASEVCKKVAHERYGDNHG